MTILVAPTPLQVIIGQKQGLRHIIDHLFLLRLHGESFPNGFHFFHDALE